MAEKYTKGDGSQTTNGDIPVVAPINMGNSLKFENKKYDVKVGKSLTLNEQGGVEVKLSKDKGNLIEARKDGLYYGINPPADTSNLYVSSSQGDDNNKGTRESPLRTIREAFRRNRANQNFTVHLYENDRHEWRSSWGRFNNYTYTMQPYGGIADSVMADNPTNSIQWARAKQLKRPTVEFVFDQTSFDTLVTSVQGDFSDQVVIFNGIRFYGRVEAEGSHIYSVFGSPSSSPNIIFRGCELNLNTDIPYLNIGKPMSPVVFDHTKVLGDNILGRIEANGSLATGFRMHTQANLENQSVGGKNVNNEPSQLTYNGFTPEADIIAKFVGNTTVVRGGIYY